MKIIPKLLLLALIVSTQAFSQLNKSYFNKLQTERVESSNAFEWKQFGPGMSGYCEEFWCHPTDANVMFMSPDMYNTYGSWDNGKSWQTIKDCDGNGLDMRRVQSIEFSRQNPNYGLAIDVTGALYKTDDKGHSWSKSMDLQPKGRYSELAVDPSNDNNWYIGAGDFWNVKSNHRTQSNLLGEVYKFSAYGCILKSSDKGQSWQKITKGLPTTLDVAKIIVNPNNSKNIILAANSGIYTSTDQGNSWTLSGKGLPTNCPRDLTSYYNKASKEFILYVLEQTIYEKAGNSVTSKGGVFKSTDGGANWVSITGNLAVDLGAITSYGARNNYWKTMAAWFGVSKDEIMKSSPTLPSEILYTYNRLVVDPTNKDIIYVTHNTKHDVSFGPGDIWQTSNGGKNWVASARSGAYWNANKDAAYWKSRNNALSGNVEFAHLERIQNEGEETSGNRFLQINLNGDVFGCIDQQVIRSNNKGASWEQIDDYETAPGSKHWVGRGGSNLPGRFMLLETGVKGRQLFCSGEHGLWQNASLDAYPDKTAVAVEQIEGQLYKDGATSIASVAVNPKDPNMIYMLIFRQRQQGQFRVSTDAGKTWKNLSKPIVFNGNESMEHIFQYSLTVDFDNPKNIYFCVMRNPITEVSGQRLPKGFTDLGVFRSTDGGLTWAIENNGFPENSAVHRIIMDPDNSSTLYAALNEGPGEVLGGLYKTTDKGDHWKEMKIPSEIKAVNNVFIDRKTKDIYISCGRDKGTLEEGGVWRSKDKGAKWEKIFDMPYIWQTETSPLNSNIITVNAALPDANKGACKINPGAYLSKDGGKNWIKINKNLGQPNTIVDLKPDPTTEGVYWCALKGSGWYKVTESKK